MFNTHNTQLTLQLAIFSEVIKQNVVTEIANKNKEIIWLKSQMLRANKLNRKNINDINNILTHSLGGMWEINFTENVVILDENAKNLFGIKSDSFMCHLNKMKLLIHPEDLIAIKNKIKLTKYSGVISHTIRFINLTEYKILIQGRLFCNDQQQVYKAAGMCLLSIII